MSVTKKLLEASGGGGEGAYVDDVFSTYVWEGDGTDRDIVNGIDLDDKGGLVWFKNREDSRNHALFDTETDPTGQYYLISNSSAATQNTGASQLTYNSDGFTIANGNSWNANGKKMASWTFAKQGGFFDVVTYTGNSVAGREIPHGLRSVPGMMIVKRTDNNANWRVYHTSLGADYWLQLNETSDKTGPSAAIWNSTEPTSTSFTVGSSSTINGSGQEYVAYLFAHDAQEFGPDGDESIIKCGSYEGNGSTNGPEIDLGWEPQWLLIKDADGANNWIVQDVMRGIATDGNDPYLQPNNSDAESGNFDSVDVNATGFKIKTSAGMFNDSGKTHIYMAIRRPNKPAEEFEPDELFAVAAADSQGSYPNWTAGFPIDMSWYNSYQSSGRNYLYSRLTGDKYLQTQYNSAEASGSSTKWDYQDGYGEWSSVNPTWMAWMFKRAPGFFDVVAQDGTSDQVFDHSLGVPPEFIMLKSRSNTQAWAVYAEPFGDGTLYLSSSAPNPAQNGWRATNTTFTVAGGLISPNQPYIAYLWASVPGICDIGSYTGTGNDLNVDCGFTNGARFVLIKRTDGSGDWYYWDTLRGIVTGNDPYLLLNSTDAQVTNTDYIDPLASGFTVTASAPADLNASGGEYIYMAIA